MRIIKLNVYGFINGVTAQVGYNGKTFLLKNVRESDIDLLSRTLEVSVTDKHLEAIDNHVTMAIAHTFI